MSQPGRSTSPPSWLLVPFLPVAVVYDTDFAVDAHIQETLFCVAGKFKSNKGRVAEENRPFLRPRGELIENSLSSIAKNERT